MNINNKTAKPAPSEAPCSEQASANTPQSLQNTSSNTPVNESRFDAQAAATHARENRAQSLSVNQPRLASNTQRLAQAEACGAPASRSQPTPLDAASTVNATTSEFDDLMTRLTATSLAPDETDAQAVTDLSDAIFKFGEQQLSWRASRNREAAEQIRSSAESVQDKNTKPQLKHLAEKLEQNAAGIDRLIQGLRKLEENQQTRLSAIENYTKARGEGHATAEPNENFMNQQTRLFEQSLQLQADVDNDRRAQAPLERATLDALNAVMRHSNARDTNLGLAGLNLDELHREFTVIVQQNDMMSHLEMAASNVVDDDLAVEGQCRIS